LIETLFIPFQGINAMDDQSVQSMVEEDRARFRVGGGRLQFRRTQDKSGFGYFHADGDIAVLHCFDGLDGSTGMTCVVLSRYRTSERQVYVGQCVCCGAVWIAGAEEAPREALSVANSCAIAGG
jgi:hypothetical protein